MRSEPRPSAFDNATITNGSYHSTLTANSSADSASGMTMTLTPGGAGTVGTASANYSTEAHSWVAVTASDNGTLAPAGASGTAGLSINAMSSSSYQAGSVADMSTTGASTTESVSFTTQESASGWDKFKHNETVGYTPTSQSGLYNTTANSHAESQYEMNAYMTSDYDGGNSTSNTFLHYHAKGSGSSDATDWEFGSIAGLDQDTTGMYKSYATGQDEYLVEVHFNSESDFHNEWATGQSSSHSETDFVESDMGDSSFLTDEVGFFDGSDSAGSYQSSSKSYDSIDYVGTGLFHSDSSWDMEGGGTSTMTYDSDYEYTGVGEFYGGGGDSGGFDPDGDTGMAYSGSSATFVSTFNDDTTMHATTDVPSHTYYYGPCSWTQPGWNSWSDSHTTMESEATYNDNASAWSQYDPTATQDGNFAEEGLDTTDTYTSVTTYSYTGPMGHIFEQSAGSTTTTTHTSSTSGAPPTDPQIIDALQGAVSPTASQNASEMPADWLAAMSDLEDLAEEAYNNPAQLAALTDAAFAELNAMDDPENPGTPIMQAAAPAGPGGGTAGASGTDWQDSSGWWWWNIWSYWGPRHAINYFSGVYDARDRSHALDVLRSANDPNTPLRPGDFPTQLTAKSQLAARAATHTEINRFIRERGVDAAMIAFGGMGELQRRALISYRGELLDLVKVAKAEGRAADAARLWKTYEMIDDVIKGTRRISSKFLRQICDYIGP